MKFKGYNFRISRTVLMNGENEKGETLFGRVCKPNDKKAVKTIYKYEGNGEPVYIKPIPAAGHSLTNMMYGEDGRIYLAYKGQCFTARYK